jgi:hypothetical protein
MSQIVGRGLILPACQAPQELSDLDESRDRTLLKPAGARLAGLVLGLVAGGDLLVTRFLTVVLGWVPFPEPGCGFDWLNDVDPRS